MFYFATNQPKGSGRGILILAWLPSFVKVCQ